MISQQLLTLIGFWDQYIPKIAKAASQRQAVAYTMALPMLVQNTYPTAFNFLCLQA